MTEQLFTALSSIKELRSSVGEIFESLGGGVRAEHGVEGRDAKYLLELQDLLNAVTMNLRDVEAAINVLTPPAGPFNLGNSSFLSQETTQDRQALYSQLVNSYKWIDKIREHSNLAANLLSHNALKRSYSTNSTKRRRPLTSSHNVLPQQVDQALTAIDRNFNDMTLKIWRPFATNVILHISLSRVLKAAVVFKGLMIEWVIVKGFEEALDDVDDLWTESRHRVFQQVRDHTHSAMLHFYSPTLPELAVRSFMTWIHSYITLFSDPCKKCGLHLHNCLPPTWRDFRTLEPFHVECKH
ncbi:mediator of RNA polymerase II transcription subunit 27 [Phlebotomus argentipes]|uniref:mediator of RNA polymerase II transcription subunit 27 n=1 Tax=Phlebotomus argentipes TaxID=94469 RepID=UPI002892E5F5|nr:mediator of RNA polymerase II transcription subunit 27 [Phlebotomus argentipes]